MPRGQPDYGLYTGTPVASGISDPGEAAARLGSINIYDRRGWTVWMDDFEAPELRWYLGQIGTGLDPVLSTRSAWRGVQSLRFQLGVALNDESNAYHRFPLIRSGRAGVEFWVNLHNLEDNNFQLLVNIWDGTNSYYAVLFLDSIARTATIMTPAGNIIVATTCFPLVAKFIWIPVKLVLDMDTDHYVRLLIGPEEIDLSVHEMNFVGVTTDRYLLTRFTLLNAGGLAGYADLDNFILTQNEP